MDQGGCCGNATGEVAGRWRTLQRRNLHRPPPSFTTSPNLLLAMEARGIEPRSENDSDTATTCVDEACGLTTAAPRRPRQQRALKNSYATRSGPRSRQPDFAIRERRLRRAATHAGA